MLIKWKHFLGAYQFCQKYRNDENSRGQEGHVICVIMTHFVRKYVTHP